MTVEYRIKPITRYIVTRFESDAKSAGVCSEVGTYDSADTAYDVGYAMCKLEHQKSGEHPESMNFIYPLHPVGSSGVMVSA